MKKKTFLFLIQSCFLLYKINAEKMKNKNVVERMWNSTVVIDYSYIYKLYLCLMSGKFEQMRPPVFPLKRIQWFSFIQVYGTFSCSCHSSITFQMSIELNNGWSSTSTIPIIFVCGEYFIPQFKPLPITYCSTDFGSQLNGPHKFLVVDYYMYTFSEFIWDVVFLFLLLCKTFLLFSSMYEWIYILAIWVIFQMWNVYIRKPRDPRMKRICHYWILKQHW